MSTAHNTVRKGRMRVKKLICLVGIIISILIIILGIQTHDYELGGYTYNASSAPSMYDSGYATFGGDFYTYVCNNAEEAASASRTVASNLNAIANFLRQAVGYGFICLGAISCCGFSIAFVGCFEKKQKVSTTKSAAKPASEPMLHADDNKDDDDEDY